MSEYWVSKKKYFCKYCEIYITDDAPSRRQHENGLRHQGNKERFVRGLYKTSEKRKQDAEEEKREMARVEQAAQAAFAQDVGSGIARARTSSSTASIASSSQKSGPSKTSSSPWANYTTAESLGIRDPDEERRQAEAARRRTMGVAGEWQMVTSAPSPGASPALELHENNAGEQHKRPAEAGVPDDDSGRGWKLKKKKLDAGLGNIYDPGLIPIKLKGKKEEPTEQSLSETKDEASTSAPTALLADGPKATFVPKWSKVQWKKPGEAPEDSPVPEASIGGIAAQEVKRDSPLAPLLIKAEDTSHTLDDSDSTKERTIIKEEDAPIKLGERSAQLDTTAAPAGDSLFKKRKAPAGTAGTRSKRGM